MIPIGVDCMGGDFGPDVVLPACESFLAQCPDASLMLVGQDAHSARLVHPRATWVSASEVVAMDDPVEVALRRKKDSSMRVALELLKSAKVAAVVSAGNTGALMAIARYVLKTLEGIDRPAIAALIPNARSEATTVLDMGANVDCQPTHLLQFAIMGAALVSVLSGKTHPTVGLLNIGEEAIKGNEVIKKTAEWLREAAAAGVLNFHGNVEGNDIFRGTVDLVVCDGFVGNVALKSSEGLARMISDSLRAEFSRNVYTRLAGALAYPVLRSLRQRVDHRRYNGAPLLGLRGLVFKSHGSADSFAFTNALLQAYHAARNQLLERLTEHIAQATPFLGRLDTSPATRAASQSPLVA
ncbi:phosphate acyltransferase PlsX [Candidatus Symbiobacter mobilis]|uniref:Phosphate acyltransferase n=1 Tax=Candidatus Symbiobacter mobilis CR TaxID=946483 RepID=U5N9M0_9BURK|nr:phosphate acyltransferase PlsX [Candidatus Symbiobacter mobilis]AGX86864.1 glycerol-3-phosphate acyltransferase PlsX [Candidatus Symbiobacter mobilis CR]